MDERTEFGWRVHDALKDWTGKVDTKASIAVALDTAVAGLLIPASRQGAPLYGLTGWRLAVFMTGLGILGLSALWAMFVVIPQLRRRSSRREWRDGVIYFGHLRHWREDDLVARLEIDHAHDVRQLAKQNIAMSKIAWRKHTALQISLVLLVVAIAHVIAAAI